MFRPNDQLQIMNSNSKSVIDLVKYPVLTEKSTRLLENNQYTFDVDLRLTKTKIKALNSFKKITPARIKRDEDDVF